MVEDPLLDPTLQKYADEKKRQEEEEAWAEERPQPSTGLLEQQKVRERAEVVGPIARGVADVWRHMREGYQALAPTYTALREFQESSGLQDMDPMDILAQMGPPGATDEFIADPLRHMMRGLPRLWNWRQEVQRQNESNEMQLARMSHEFGGGKELWEDQTPVGDEKRARYEAAQLAITWAAGVRGTPLNAEAAQRVYRVLDQVPFLSTEDSELQATQDWVKRPEMFIHAAALYNYPTLSDPQQQAFLETLGNMITLEMLPEDVTQMILNIFQGENPIRIAEARESNYEIEGMSLDPDILEGQAAQAYAAFAYLYTAGSGIPIGLDTFYDRLFDGPNRTQVIEDPSKVLVAAEGEPSLERIGQLAEVAVEPPPRKPLIGIPLPSGKKIGWDPRTAWDRISEGLHMSETFGEVLLSYMPGTPDTFEVHVTDPSYGRLRATEPAAYKEIELRPGHVIRIPENDMSFTERWKQFGDKELDIRASDILAMTRGGRAVLAAAGGLEPFLKGLPQEMILSGKLLTSVVPSLTQWDIEPTVNAAKAWTSFKKDLPKEVFEQTLRGWEGERSTLADIGADLAMNPVWWAMMAVAPEAKLLQVAGRMGRFTMAPLIHSPKARALLDVAARSQTTKPVRWLWQHSPWGEVSKGEASVSHLSLMMRRDTPADDLPGLIGRMERFLKAGAEPGGYVPRGLPPNARKELLKLRDDFYKGLELTGKPPEEALEGALISLRTAKSADTLFGDYVWDMARLGIMNRTGLVVGKVNPVKWFANAMKYYLSPWWLTMRVGYHVYNFSTNALQFIEHGSLREAVLNREIARTLKAWDDAGIPYMTSGSERGFNAVEVTESGIQGGRIALDAPARGRLLSMGIPKEALEPFTLKPRNLLKVGNFRIPAKIPSLLKPEGVPGLKYPIKWGRNLADFVERTNRGALYRQQLYKNFQAGFKAELQSMGLPPEAIGIVMGAKTPDEIYRVWNAYMHRGTLPPVDSFLTVDALSGSAVGHVLEAARTAPGLRAPWEDLPEAAAQRLSNLRTQRVEILRMVGVDDPATGYLRTAQLKAIDDQIALAVHAPGPGVAAEGERLVANSENVASVYGRARETFDQETLTLLGALARANKINLEKLDLAQIRTVSDFADDLYTSDSGRALLAAVNEALQILQINGKSTRTVDTIVNARNRDVAKGLQEYIKGIKTRGDITGLRAEILSNLKGITNTAKGKVDDLLEGAMPIRNLPAQPPKSAVSDREWNDFFINHNLPEFDANREINYLGDVFRRYDKTVTSIEVARVESLRRLTNSNSVMRFFNKVVPEDLEAAWHSALNKAQWEANRRMNQAFFDYGAKRNVDWLLDHAVPYSFWWTRFTAQQLRYAVDHPMAAAVALRTMQRWWEDTEDLPWYLRFSVYSHDDAEGNKYYFQPLRMFFPLGMGGLEIIRAADGSLLSGLPFVPNLGGATRRDDSPINMMRDLAEGFGLRLYPPYKAILDRFTGDEWDKIQSRQDITQFSSIVRLVTNHARTLLPENTWMGEALRKAIPPGGVEPVSDLLNYLSTGAGPLQKQTQYAMGLLAWDVKEGTKTEAEARQIARDLFMGTETPQTQELWHRINNEYVERQFGPGFVGIGVTIRTKEATYRAELFDQLNEITEPGLIKAFWDEHPELSFLAQMYRSSKSILDSLNVNELFYRVEKRGREDAKDMEDYTLEGHTVGEIKAHAAALQARNDADLAAWKEELGTRFGGSFTPAAPYPQSLGSFGRNLLYKLGRTAFHWGNDVANWTDERGIVDFPGRKEWVGHFFDMGMDPDRLFATRVQDDTLPEAVVDSYTNHYLGPFYDGLDKVLLGKKGDDRALARRDYIQKNPIPTNDLLTRWVAVDFAEKGWTYNEIAKTIAAIELTDPDDFSEDQQGRFIQMVADDSIVGFRSPSGAEVTSENLEDYRQALIEHDTMWEAFDKGAPFQRTSRLNKYFYGGPESDWALKELTEIDEEIATLRAKISLEQGGTAAYKNAQWVLGDRIDELEVRRHYLSNVLREAEGLEPEPFTPATERAVTKEEELQDRVRLIQQGDELTLAWLNLQQSRWLSKWAPQEVPPSTATLNYLIFGGTSRNSPSAAFGAFYALYQYYRTKANIEGHPDVQRVLNFDNKEFMGPKDYIRAMDAIFAMVGPVLDLPPTETSQTIEGRRPATQALLPEGSRSGVAIAERNATGTVYSRQDIAVATQITEPELEWIQDEGFRNVLWPLSFGLPEAEKEDLTFDLTFPAVIQARLSWRDLLIAKAVENTLNLWGEYNYRQISDYEDLRFLYLARIVKQASISGNYSFFDSLEREIQDLLKLPQNLIEDQDLVSEAELRDREEGRFFSYTGIKNPRTAAAAELRRDLVEGSSGGGVASWRDYEIFTAYVYNDTSIMDRLATLFIGNQPTNTLTPAERQRLFALYTYMPGRASSFEEWLELMRLLYGLRPPPVMPIAQRP